MAKSYRTQPPGSYTFSKEERNILREEKKAWSQSSDNHSGNVMQKAKKRIVEKYKEDHNGTIEETVQLRLDNAVRRWILLNCKQAKALDKKGSKSRSWRQVAYVLHKTEILRRADRLAEKYGGNRFTHHQKALSGFCRKLSIKKKNEYMITARVWNKVGPPERVKKHKAATFIHNRSFSWCQELLKQHGAVFVMHYAFKDEEDRVVTGVLEHNRVLINRSFLNDYGAEYDASGTGDLWREWALSHMVGSGTLTASPAKLTGKGAAPFIAMDSNEYGEPTLPSPTEIPSGYTPKSYHEALTRSFLSTHYALAMGVFEDRVKIHWTALVSKGIRTFIEEEYLPDDLANRFGDPCRMGDECLLGMLMHWWRRQERGCEIIFEFSHWLRYRRPPREHEIHPREPRQIAPPIHEPMDVDINQGTSPIKGRKTNAKTKSSSSKATKAQKNSGGGRSKDKGKERKLDDESEAEFSDTQSHAEESDLDEEINPIDLPRYKAKKATHAKKPRAGRNPDPAPDSGDEDEQEGPPESDHGSRKSADVWDDEDDWAWTEHNQELDYQLDEDPQASDEEADGSGPGGNQDPAPPPVKKCPQRKKAEPVEDTDDSDDNQGPDPTPVKQRKKAEPVEDLEDSDDNQDPAPPPVKKRPQRKKAEPVEDPDDSDDNQDPAPSPVKKRKKAEPVEDLEDSDNNQGPAPPPVKKRLQRKKAEPVEDPDDSDDNQDPAPPPVKKRPQRTTTAKPVPEQRTPLQKRLRSGAAEKDVEPKSKRLKQDLGSRPTRSRVNDSPAKNTRSRGPTKPTLKVTSPPRTKPRARPVRKKKTNQSGTPDSDEEDSAALDNLFDLRRGRNPSP